MRALRKSVLGRRKTEEKAPASASESFVDIKQMISPGGSLYKYRPLDRLRDSIRVLVLHPLRKDDKESIIRCTLVHTTFLERPKYEALSYAWGNPTPTKRIFIDDVEVSIRDNLYTALCNLRLDGDERRLWADAICIDQSNDKERQYQVRLMSYIYSRAQRVLVWLGQGAYPSIGWFRDESRSSAPDWKRESGSWLWIAKRSYWRRLWIIQEIGLARNLQVCIGRHCYEWDIFFHAFDVASRSVHINFSLREDPDRNGMRDTSLIMKDLDAKRKGRHDDSNRLEVLIEDFQYAQCAENRDKIYGFLGLAHDCEDGSIEPDYTRPLFDLYSDTIKFFHRPRLLPNGDTGELDRSMRVVRFSQLIQRQLGGGIFSLAKSTSTEIFQAKAVIVSRVLQLGPTYDEMISSSAANQKWLSTFQIHYPLPQHIRQLREANEAYSEILLGMQPERPQRFSCLYPGENGLYSRAAQTGIKWDTDERNWSQPDPDHRTGREPNDQSKLEFPAQHTSVPNMFLGENFSMGLAPYEAQNGDLICQFWKTDIAALLRREPDTSTYRVIGRVHLCSSYMEDLKPVHKPWNEIPEDAKTMHVEMDIQTLSFLTC